MDIFIKKRHRYSHCGNSSKPNENNGSGSRKKLRLKRFILGVFYSAYFYSHNFWRGAIKLMYVCWGDKLANEAVKPSKL